MRLSHLRPGEVLRRGLSVLIYQHDGNLVLYRRDQPVWASMAFGDPGICQMQADGNVVCYDRTGTPYWHTGTHGHPGATCVLQDDGNLVIYAASGEPVWATGTVSRDADVPPPPSRWKIYGNFLANGIEPFGFMAMGWRMHDTARYDRFITAYVAAGYRHLPCAIWGEYPGETWYDYRPQLRVFAEALDEWLARGITPIVFVLTDDRGDPLAAPGQIVMAKQILEELGSRTALNKFEWCMGWELNQVAGWRETRNPLQGHHMIDLARMIKAVTGKAPWLHLQPNWWAPHYQGADEDAWWRDVGDNCCGLLGQIAPDSPLELLGDPAFPHGLYLMLEYPRSSDGARGIAGRLAARGKQFVMFEHSRTLARWARVREIVERDPRVVGIC